MNSKAKRSIYLFASVLILSLLLVGCGTEEVTPDPNGSTNDSSPAGSNEPLQGTATPTSLPPTPSVEMETVYMLEEGEVQMPVLPPATFSELLAENVEEEIWELGEGFVLLLQFVAGELSSEEIPGFMVVKEPNPTGLLRGAVDYLNDPESDSQYHAEIERLLGKLTPSQEDLDRFSQPSNQSNRSGMFLASVSQQASVPSECANIVEEGFSAEVDTGEFCYIFKEASQGSYRHRVYYPKWWDDEPEKIAWVDETLTTLSESAAIYSTLGTLKNINVVFNLSQPQDELTTLASQAYFLSAEPCPITVQPLVNESSLENYKQTIAHEAFHCFQDWNFSSSPYEVHEWWLEGSAEYFSNVVYPTTNDEHVWLGDYYARSIRQPWFDMSYHNFLLFQFFGNQLGDPGLISLLDRVSASGAIGGQAATLANYGNMDGLFLEFVVKTMGPGIEDTGGGAIVQDRFPVIRVERITEKGEKKFEIDPFVAGRFGVSFEQEKRFLEEPTEDENVRHSSAAAKLRKDLSAWSDLPPEIRSYCDKDEKYALAVTAVKAHGTLKDDVSLMEKAECDPCLLGTWDTDKQSFQAYIQRVLETQGMGELPPGAFFEIGGEGHDYIQFNEEGEILTRRVDFTIRTGMEDNPAMITIIDSQGSGKYTADGEEMVVSDLVDTVNQILSTIEGSGFTVNQTPNASTYSFFGASASGEGFGDISGGPETVSADYVCTKETLEVTQPVYGSLLLNRVEEILPTPVPTPSP